MIYPFWRLSEHTPDNLGLAFTDDSLLLGQTPLVERRDGRFVVRERSEIERLLKRAHSGAPPVDRIISGLATVASALNANDQCAWRGSRRCICGFPICQTRWHAMRWRRKIRS
jgi:hypothetical protein